jgi:hypothetical protein
MDYVKNYLHPTPAGSRTRPIKMFTAVSGYLAVACLLTSLVTVVRGQGTAFTYQGRLTDGGSPANGIYDLRFILYTADPGGNQQGPVLTNIAVQVSAGQFVVTLDFGSDAFPGADRFLDIAVRTNGFGAFSILSPRQKLTPTHMRSRPPMYRACPEAIQTRW